MYEDEGCVHSPTSPADDKAPGIPVTGAFSSARAGGQHETENDAADFEFAYRVLGNNNTTTEFGDGSQVDVPILRVGRKFDKELRLRANRWIKIGRNPKSQLLLNVTGVSRDHCTLRWDPHTKQVELRDTSRRGTFVNGEATKNKRRVLVHGDQIILEAKSQRFTFVLDLRPVGLGFRDPIKDALMGTKADMRKEKMTRRRRRADLLTQIRHVNDKYNQVKAIAFEKEQEYFEISARISVRRQKDEELQKKLKEMQKSTAELNAQLEGSRVTWLQTLAADQKRFEAEARPYADLTAELQTQLEKLKLKKAEVERNLNPDKYAFLEAGSGPISGDSHSQHELSGSGVGSAEGSVDGRRSGDYPESEEDHALDTSPAGPAKTPAAPAAPAPTLEADPALVAKLFGDFESGDEAEAPLAGAGPPTEPKGAKAQEGSVAEPEGGAGDDDDEPLTKKPRVDPAGDM